MEQMSLFDGSKRFVVDKPIRLISLFSGYDSQEFALKYLGVNYEHWKTCEWAVKSIQALKDAHYGNDNTDYSANHSQEFIAHQLFKWGISANYNEPMTKEQIKRLGEQKQRQIYNNIKATHNLVNIQQVSADRLEIVDRDEYCYLMTYSFPCQDLSKAGKGKGMAKDSGTRSGMLWEVERILDECNGNLPQILLMENVPDVIGSKNIECFAKWLEKLESIGYKCYWKVLNAKDYGIPQNRKRCFMISLLGDYYYEFPQIIKTNIKTDDILEDKFDEKFILGKTSLSGKLNTKFNTSKLESIIPNNKGIMPTLCARDYKDAKCVIITKTDNDYVEIKDKKFPITKNNDNFIEWKQKGYLESDCRAWKTDKLTGVLTTNGKIKILKDFIIRKCTPKEYFRLMGVKDEDFEKIAQNQSNASLYHLVGDSIVVNVLMALFGKLFEKE